MPTIVPVILCGGSGTRLWPRSRAAKPKPFLPLIGDKTLFEAALLRCPAGGGFAAPVVVTGHKHLELVEAQLAFFDESTCDFAALDAALDKLAAASLPIKQRTLVAAAHVVGADGQILIAEAELLRAISAALDVPMPPLASVA